MLPRSRGTLLPAQEEPFRTRHMRGRDERGPGLAGFHLELSGPARDGRDVQEDMAAWALNLPAGKLFVTLQVLFAFRARKFEFAHVMVTIRTPEDTPIPAICKSGERGPFIRLLSFQPYAKERIFCARGWRDAGGALLPIRNRDSVRLARVLAGGVWARIQR